MSGDTKKWAPSHLRDAYEDLKSCMYYVEEGDPEGKKWALGCIEVTIQSLNYIKKALKKEIDNES